MNRWKWICITVYIGQATNNGVAFGSPQMSGAGRSKRYSGKQTKEFACI